ncbi:hypothetical protein F2P81_019482 [Scophthalmus maximus]|uniref:Uncharacterized protein n=1 Tax=Scophthalmus maximus TaxID=52904 RepID=A0A6A4S7Y0_SCOMX|nr:hypothetical protein F2P81_019482 [Scophthalmus maximus]
MLVLLKKVQLIIVRQRDTANTCVRPLNRSECVVCVLMRADSEHQLDIVKSGLDGREAKLRPRATGAKLIIALCVIK